MPQSYLFAPGELAALSCPCGSPVVASDPIVNDDGDLVQFGFCPVCGIAPPQPDEPWRWWLPKALRLRGAVH
jgi:hypothetical protein